MTDDELQPFKCRKSRMITALRAMGGSETEFLIERIERIPIEIDTPAEGIEGAQAEQVASIERVIIEISQLITGLIITNIEGNVDSSRILKINLQFSKLLTSLQEISLEQGEPSPDMRKKINEDIQILLKHLIIE